MKNQRKIDIGVGVVVVHPTERKVLTTRRLKGLGKGALACPGGKIEEQEQCYETAKREVLEETSLIIEPRLLNGYTFVWHAEEWFREKKHQWTIYLVADIVGGVLANPEPHKHSDWKWKSLEELKAECKDTDWIPIQAMFANRERLRL